MVPGTQAMSGGTKQMLKYGAVGIGGALAGAAISRLVYPGHKVFADRLFLL